jgi:hypothetical protein
MKLNYLYIKCIVRHCFRAGVNKNYEFRIGSIVDAISTYIFILNLLISSVI